MGQTHALRLFTTLLLSVSIALQPVLAKKHKKLVPIHDPAFKGQAFEGLDYFPHADNPDFKKWNEQLRKEVDEAGPTNMEKVRASGADLNELIQAYSEYFIESEKDLLQSREEVGEEMFLERLDENFYQYRTRPELGTLEFTTIDGEPVGKIVHEESGVSFIIYNTERTDKNTDHFQSYLARQHYDAGPKSKVKYRDIDGKKKKVKTGRDVLLMGVKNHGVIDSEKVELLPREHNLKKWWLATKGKPRAKLGFAGAAIQTVSVAGLATIMATGLSYALPEVMNVPQDETTLRTLYVCFT